MCGGAGAGAEKETARGELQPGEGGRGIGGDCGLRGCGWGAQGSGFDAGAWAEGRDAGELCGAGTEQCSELHVELQQRADAGVAEQAGDARIYAYDVYGGGGGVRIGARGGV